MQLAADANVPNIPYSLPTPASGFKPQGSIAGNKSLGSPVSIQLQPGFIHRQGHKRITTYLGTPYGYVPRHIGTYLLQATPKDSSMYQVCMYIHTYIDRHRGHSAGTLAIQIADSGRPDRRQQMNLPHLSKPKTAIFVEIHGLPMLPMQAEKKDFVHF